MKVIVNGAAGKMGGEVCRLAAEGKSGASLFAMADRAGGPEIRTSLADCPSGADVIIDFSHHDATDALTAYAVAQGIPLVVATTGHTEPQIDLIRKAAETIPVFFSANMSLGVALLVDLAKRAARVFPDADIEIIEKHHNRKLDAPSGTALMIAKGLAEVREQTSFVYGRCGQQKRQPGEIGIHAVRAGNIVGEHEVLIATDSQILTLTHQALSRSLFAEGALSAAAFLIRQKPGLYTMADLAGEDAKEA